MKSFDALAKMYYLIIHADGEVTRSEFEIASCIMEIENITSKEFYGIIEKFQENSNNQNRISECISDLELLPKPDQITCMAWMSIIASIDGGVSANEWDLISKIYVDAFELNEKDVESSHESIMARINKTAPTIVLPLFR